MQGTFLRFYVHENSKHHSILLYEWLLEKARELGIHGGTAFRAIAGFGRHGILHEQHFFELAGDLPVVVDFILSEAQAQGLFELIDAERIRLVYMQAPVEYDTRNPDAP